MDADAVTSVLAQRVSSIRRVIDLSGRTHACVRTETGEESGGRRERHETKTARRRRTTQEASAGKQLVYCFPAASCDWSALSANASRDLTRVASTSPRSKSLKLLRKTLQDAYK